MTEARVLERSDTGQQYTTCWIGRSGGMLFVPLRRRPRGPSGRQFSPEDRPDKRFDS